jgi:hypothetical protein
MNAWCPGADLIGLTRPGGMMDGAGGPRVVWHRTVGGSYASNIRVLQESGNLPHLLWDPFSGELGQFLPATRSAYALVHDGPPTNTHGLVCIQIEVVDHGETWDVTSTPMRGYYEYILPWLRNWGIPDACPAGAFPPLGTSGNRSETIWAIRPGHYAHAQIPGNNHTDPGRMVDAIMFPRRDDEDMTLAEMDKLLNAIWDVRYPRKGDAHNVNLQEVLDEIKELKLTIGNLTAMVNALSG